MYRSVVVSEELSPDQQQIVIVEESPPPQAARSDHEEDTKFALLQDECARRMEHQKEHRDPYQLPRSKEPGGRRISCHMCGNIRKNITVCTNRACPQVFCRNCIAKILEQHGHTAFNEGCPFCKRLCCCALVKTSPVCNNKYHCYRKCPVLKSAERAADARTPLREVPPIWHEPHCSCSREFIERNVLLTENVLAAGVEPQPSPQPVTAKITKKRTLQIETFTTPMNSRMHNLFESDVPSPSLGKSPYPPLVKEHSAPRNTDYLGSAAHSFFDQCEEEFRRGLKKTNIDKIVSQYEQSLKQ